MKGRSALPRTAYAVALIALAAGTAGAIWGRDLLAELPYFDVRQIEVVGARFVAPDSVVQLAAIGSTRSVWEDYPDVERRLLTHPLIEGVEVRRHGLRTLRLVIREVEPLALVDLGELRAVRSDGTPLPIDLAGTALDLPVLTMAAQVDTATGRVGGRASGALQLFARLRSRDPGLAAMVSDFHSPESGGIVANLVVSQPARRLLLPREIDEKLVARIRAALADLRRRGTIAAEVEARFADQIVIRLQSS